jgi:hypothetical protein
MFFSAHFKDRIEALDGEGEQIFRRRTLMSGAHLHGSLSAMSGVY